MKAKTKNTMNNNKDLDNDPGRLPDQISAVVDNDLERLKKLIESGCSPNEIDNYDYTCLHYAVINQNEEIFDYLLTLQDVKIDVRNRDKMTPLMLAVHHNREDFVQKLINRGADINIQDVFGNTPLHYAVVKSLSIAVAYIKWKADINSQNMLGETPLIVACKEKKWDIVHMLLYYGADAMICDNSGIIPFVYCLWHSPPEELEILFNYSFDEVKTRIKLNTLLEIMKTEPPIFYQIVEKVSHILYTKKDLKYHQNMLFDVKTDMLKILLDKFPKFVYNYFKVFDDHIPLPICSSNMSDFIEKFYILSESQYIETIIDKCLPPPFMGLLLGAKLPENTVIEFVCCLLSYGFPLHTTHLDWTYHYYGFALAVPPTERIIGGNPAIAGQFPSAAAIYVTTSGGAYFCGGSLINQQWVLTAAHCIIAGYQYEIVLGSNSLTGSDPNRVTVATSYRVIHPYYNYNTLQNDIALIKLRSPIEYTDYIQPINLPDEDVEDHLETTAIGWGQISDNDAGLANNLHYVTVTTIPNEECQSSFSSTIFDNMVCIAGNYNQGTCHGDTGGPLIKQIGNKQYHVGISCFLSGKGCESTDPSGYTRTFPYVEWVRIHAIVDQ